MRKIFLLILVLAISKFAFAETYQNNYDINLAKDLNTIASVEFESPTGLYKIFQATNIEDLNSISLGWIKQGSHWDQFGWNYNKIKVKCQDSTSAICTGAGVDGSGFIIWTDGGYAGDATLHEYRSTPVNSFPSSTLCSGKDFYTALFNGCANMEVNGEGDSSTQYAIYYDTNGGTPSAGFESFASSIMQGETVMQGWLNGHSQDFSATAHTYDPDNIYTFYIDKTTNDVYTNFFYNDEGIIFSLDYTGDPQFDGDYLFLLPSYLNDEIDLSSTTAFEAASSTFDFATTTFSTFCDYLPDTGCGYTDLTCSMQTAICWAVVGDVGGNVEALSSEYYDFKYNNIPIAYFSRVYDELASSTASSTAPINVPLSNLDSEDFTFADVTLIDLADIESSQEIYDILVSFETYVQVALYGGFALLVIMYFTRKRW